MTPLPSPPTTRHRSLRQLREREPRWRSTLALIAFVLIAFALLVLANPARADDADALRAESPYFFIPGGDAGVDRLPLKATRVDATVLGPIADVAVTQTYRNEGSRPIEAIYVFPGSAGAAVHAMTVRIGDRVIRADIREKQAARVEFETAKKQGKTAALLEQHRPNVFRMNVANILPGDEVNVELRYTELLVPRDGEYAFVFPTVVGPRYNSPSGEARRETWVAQPILPAGERPNHSLELNVALLTALPVAQVASPSHAIEVLRPEDRRVEVSVVSGDDGGPPNDRDFILHYRLAGDRIDAGAMLYQASGGGDHNENFFVAMVEPPAQIEPAAILPRDYIFVVDISGSMHGFPLDTAKVLMNELLRGLRPSDSFNVLLFSGSARTLNPESVPATQANINAALALLRETAGGGGTEIVPALKRLASMPKRADSSRTIVVVTDGYVAVEREVFELVRKQLGDANVFAFGIGSSVNRHLIEGIARAGAGEAFVLTKPQFAAEQARRFRRMIDAPVMVRVTARFEGIETSDIEPRALPDLLGNRPLVLYGKWKAGELAPDARLVVEGQTANGPQRIETALAGTVSRDSAALRHLWARSRIASLSDDEALQGGRAHKAEITALGLKYGLLTDYTSFIAVDRIVRAVSEEATKVDQPSPLPHGVSNLAVGAELPSTPEPEAWAAAVVMMFMLALLLRRRRARPLPPTLSPGGGEGDGSAPSPARGRGLG